MILRGAKVYQSEGAFHALDVRIQGNRIVEVAEELLGDEVVLLQGGYLLPGMIDLHTHGFGGHDTMDGLDAILSMSKAYASKGVTAFLPTTMNAPIDEVASTIACIETAMASAQGAKVLGAHMEGPFIDCGYKGAQLASAILLPTVENLHALCGGKEHVVKLVTLAPELAGAEATIRYACSCGMVVSAGHTAATYEQTVQAIDWGVTQFTHLFNAMTPIHHRDPGVPTAALLDDRVTVQVIADGIHLHPAILQLVARVKPDGITLITDSMMAAGLSDGTYSLGGQEVIVKDGAARLAAGNLAGSVLTLDQGLRNMVRFCGLSLEQVVPMTSTIPAKVLGLDQMGYICAGNLADLCLLDETLMPCKTWVDGILVYDR